jgi:hypothetical protein
MLTVAVRPRLDRRFDVIQSRAPQFLGAFDRREDALALAEWAARRHPPSEVVVFGADGATVLDRRSIPEGAAPTPGAHAGTP